MLLDAYGRLARRQDLALTAQGVRCLVDGKFFVRHAKTILKSLQLEPYCLVCAGAGSDPHIETTPHEHLVQFRCAHIAGHVQTDRPDPLDVEPLLATLSWGLRCTACHENVSGDNSKSSAQFTVECGCTTRALANPLAAMVSASPAIH